MCTASGVFGSSALQRQRGQLQDPTTGIITNKPISQPKAPQPHCANSKAHHAIRRLISVSGFQVCLIMARPLPWLLRKISEYSSDKLSFPFKLTLIIYQCCCRPSLSWPRTWNILDTRARLRAIKISELPDLHGMGLWFKMGNSIKPTNSIPTAPWSTRLSRDSERSPNLHSNRNYDNRVFLSSHSIMFSNLYLPGPSPRPRRTSRRQRAGRLPLLSPPSKRPAQIIIPTPCIS